MEVWDDDGLAAQPGFLGEAMVDVPRLGWKNDAPGAASLFVPLEKNFEKSKRQVSGSLQVFGIWTTI